VGIAAEYVEADDLLVVVWHGLVSGAEWRQFVGRRVTTQESWPAGRRRLADLSTLDPSLLSTADIENVLPLYRDRIGNLIASRQAIVAALAWDLARDFERRIDGLGATTVVFDRVDDACHWLGTDPVSTRQVITTLRDSLRDASAET
jgi:hypothetical protein